MFNKTKHSKSGRKASHQTSSSTGTTLIPFDFDKINLTDKFSLSGKVANKFFTIKSSDSLGFIAQNATTQQFAQITFTLAGNCLDYLNLAAVFDQYRLVGVECIARPRSNTAVQTAGSIGNLYAVADYDDAAALTTTGQALSYSDCVATPVYQPNRRAIKPRVAVAAYSGAFTSFANVDAPWIDCGSSGVVHYGIKYALDTGVAGSLVTFDLVVRAQWEFRSSR